MFRQRPRPIALSCGCLGTPLFAFNSRFLTACSLCVSPMGLCGGLRYSPSTRVSSAPAAICPSYGILQWTPLFALKSRFVSARPPCVSLMGLCGGFRRFVSARRQFFWCSYFLVFSFYFSLFFFFFHRYLIRLI